MERGEKPEADAREVLSRILRGDENLDSHQLPWEELDLLTVAIDQRVHLLLAKQLQARAAFDQCPADVREILQTAIREEALAERVSALELGDILDCLALAGIYPILLKGVSLAYTCYPQPYLRPHMDVDLLIRKQDAAAVQQVMERAGYHRPNYVEGDRIQHQFHYEKHHLAALVHAYDFHWRVANPELFADLLSFDDAERSAVKIPAISDHARTVSDVHALLLASVHRVAHHGDSNELLWLYDIHLLAQRLTAIGWHRFETLASQTATRRICKVGLELATHAFRTCLPDHVMDTLADVGDEPTAAFLGGGLREIDIQLSNFRHLRGWRARWQLVRQNLFPASAYMLKAYNVGNPVWLPALYIHRIVRGAPHWFRPARKRAAT